jgi:DNA-binding MarR family transcriptional regulator
MTLPGRLRRSPVNLLADRIDRVMLAWSRSLRLPEADTGLTPERLEVLDLLATTGPLSLGELSVEVGVSPPAITRLVSGLEDRGLVWRGPADADHRVVMAAITAGGRRALDRGRGNRLRALADHLRALGPQDRRALERAFEVLQRMPAP